MRGYGLAHKIITVANMPNSDIFIGGTPSASSEFGSAYLAEFAFDKSLATRWGSAAGPPAWLQYDLAVGVVKTAYELIFTPYASRVKDYRVAGSTDNFVSNETVIYSGQCPNEGTEQTVIIGDTTGYSSYRFYVDTYWGTSIVIVYELVITGDDVSAPVIEIFKETAQLVASIITFSSTQIINQAPTLSIGFQQILAQAKQLALEHDQSFDTAIPLHLQIDQSPQIMAVVQLACEQIIQAFGAPVALEFLQTWYNYGYNEAILPFVQVIGGQISSSIQQLQFSVTVAGVSVGVTACTFDRSGLAVLATLTLRSHADWVNKWPGDTVVITWLGEQYNLVVVDKPSQGQVGQGTLENGYILECMSITFQLSEVFNNELSASRVTLSYTSGTLATEILDDLTAGVCSYSLNVPDFPVGAFDFDDSERYAALLQVFPASYGWVLDTDKNGVLHISSFQFPSAAVQKTLYFTSKSLTPPEGVFYNEVRIRNFDQTSGTTGLRLEIVDNGDGTGTIHGYSVPWNPDFSIYDSEDASAPSLIIQGGFVEEVEVTDSNIEFIEFAASLSKPCYSAPVFEWGGNDSLEPLTFDESGGLVTAIDPGYSVATSATYITRRRTWTYDNRRTDPTQARAKYNG